MQRVRIGLTGLAFVFLLVMLGTAISRSGGDEPVAAGVNAAAANANDEPNEPLAELGVAPGESQADNQANAAKQ